MDPTFNDPVYEEPFLVATIASAREMMDRLPLRTDGPPSLYVDVAGRNVSRHGGISLISIHVHPEDVTYLIDVTTLGGDAFDTPGPRGNTLKSILESKFVKKAFFDVRNDSDALFSHFGLRLSAVEDVQLMELASRTFGKLHVTGLTRCVENDRELFYTTKFEFKAIKEKSRSFFGTGKEGHFDEYETRPITQPVKSFCVQNVIFLPRLWSKYEGRLTLGWKEEIANETTNRIMQSQSPSYNGKGQHMALAPKHWNGLSPTEDTASPSNTVKTAATNQAKSQPTTATAEYQQVYGPMKRQPPRRTGNPEDDRMFNLLDRFMSDDETVDRNGAINRMVKHFVEEGRGEKINR